MRQNGFTLSHLYEGQISRGPVCNRVINNRASRYLGKKNYFEVKLVLKGGLSHMTQRGLAPTQEIGFINDSCRITHS